MRKIDNCFQDIISPVNLWQSWIDYRSGKRKREAVSEFEKNLENNLIELKSELEKGTYKHGDYKTFLIHDPKQRLISTPLIKDHIVHQAIYNVLYPFYDRLFLPFSFSCRVNKGTYLAINIFKKYLRQTSNNGKRECWILHGDIEKCFDSIEHKILFNLLRKRISCLKTLDLLEKIIASYESDRHYPEDFWDMTRGIPLGNLTSQLFINIYLDFLDRFVKEKLKIKKYLRYGDDFLIIYRNKLECEETAEKIRQFLWLNLKLKFPKSYERINKLSQGTEVLGVRFLPLHDKIRPLTRHRVEKLFTKRCQEYSEEKISLAVFNASWQSLCGLLKYGYNFRFKKKLLNLSYQSFKCRTLIR